EAQVMGTRATQAHGMGVPRLSDVSVSSSPQVIQRAYKQKPLDPTTQRAAILFRARSGNFAGLFNVATVTLFDQAEELQGKDTARSQGEGPSTHGEREALKGAMQDAKIDGFDSENGTRTGKALKQEKTKQVIVYTELPPCPGCGPYLGNVEQELGGDVLVGYSGYL